MLGELSDRADPSHLAVDVLTGPTNSPGHRHFPGQRGLPGIVASTQRVETVQMPFGLFVGQPQSVLDVQQDLDMSGQVTDETVHGRAPVGSIPAKSRQQSRICLSSAAR